MKYQKGFRQLIAWQKAHQLRREIYRITKSFPREELFSVVDQMKRAANSIAAQLAEGSRMPTSAHRKLYYDRAYASAAEVDDFLELSHDLGYITNYQYEALTEHVNKTSMFIYHLSKASTPNTPRTPPTPVTHR